MSEPNDGVHYPFKRLDQLWERDAPALMLTLEGSHGILDQIMLHRGVPVDIRQLFETAKNIALYSYFAYRLQQPAELVAFSAFEWALNEQAKIECPELFSPKKKAPTLFLLCSLAIKKHWITDKNFPSKRAYAYRLVSSEKARGRVEQMRAGLHVKEADEPTEAEIDAAMQEFSMSEYFVNLARKKRNTLAHGSVFLMPSAHGTLEVVSEAINQLFPEPA